MSLKKWQNGAKSATIVVDITKVSTGHHAHRSGAGSHDNRPKRLRTRSAQKNNWKKEW